MQQPRRPLFTLRLKPAAMMLALALTSMSVMPDAYAQPVRGSSLYYRMGGGSPGGSANYRGQVAHNLGFGANARLNYSCGKFDIGLSWANIMNNLNNLGQTVTGAIQSGIAALPCTSCNAHSQACIRFSKTIRKKWISCLGPA